MNIQRARDLRNNPTEAEQRLWHKLKRRQTAGAKFRRQQPLGPYIVDFVCFEHRLVVEVDGGQHAERVAADEGRTRWLQQQGYRVLRFWNNEVLAHTDEVAQVILNYVQGAGSLYDPPPPSSPTRGEEGAIVTRRASGVRRRA
jgi:very-short-patch-repair endonuclease